MKGSPLPLGSIVPQEAPVGTATDLDVFRFLQRLRREGRRLPLFSRFVHTGAFAEPQTGGDTCVPFNLIYNATDTPYAVPGARFHLHFLRLQVTLYLPGMPPETRRIVQRHFHLRLSLISEWNTTTQGSLDQTVVLNSILTHPNQRGAESFQFFSNWATTPDVIARGWDYIPLWFARGHMSHVAEAGHLTLYQPAQWEMVGVDAVVTSQPAAVSAVKHIDLTDQFCCYDVVVPLDCIHQICAESTNHLSSGFWRMFPMLCWDVASSASETIDNATPKITVRAELIYTFE